MGIGSWSDALAAILNNSCLPEASVETRRINPGANTYLVRSYERSALQFSFPAFIRCSLIDDRPEVKRGSDGAVGAFIEEVKKKSHDSPELRLIGGLDTSSPRNYSYNLEPVTFCKSSAGTGQRLWKADQSNYLGDNGISIILSGAFPYPGDPNHSNIRQVEEQFSQMLEAVSDIASGMEDNLVEEYALCSADQKLLRSEVDSMGLVSFIGDGTRPVRDYTHHRGNFRMAGPRQFSNVPFRCPDELEPVEVELPASGKIITGLGIRKSELFAVSGSNAQGKSTFLQTVKAGSDDHMPGDGRECVVTSGRVMTAESGETDVSGSNISMFFSALPPGVSGTPKSVHGRGSGSMVMAAQFMDAVRKRASLIVIDEDRSATNLLVPNCMQSDDITPLSVICREQREKLGESALIFAAATMDILVAEADRIMEFDDHMAKGIDRQEFRSMLKRHLDSVLRSL